MEEGMSPREIKQIVQGDEKFQSVMSSGRRRNEQMKSDMRLPECKRGRVWKWGSKLEQSLWSACRPTSAPRCAPSSAVRFSHKASPSISLQLGPHHTDTSHTAKIQTWGRLCTRVCATDWIPTASYLKSSPFISQTVLIWELICFMKWHEHRGRADVHRSHRLVSVCVGHSGVYVPGMRSTHTYWIEAFPSGILVITLNCRFVPLPSSGLHCVRVCQLCFSFGFVFFRDWNNCRDKKFLVFVAFFVFAIFNQCN